MESFKELIVWQRSMELTKMIYQCTQCFPKEEQFGLTSQIERSSISVPSNISEGFGREHRRDFLRFLRITRGSLFELETQLILASEIFPTISMDIDILIHKCTELEKMLNKLITYVGKTIMANKS